MSREIKFRAWNGEEMISPDYITRDGYGYWKENSIPTRSKELMQYTGLKDKNGKEIYEGDIVEFHGNYTSIERCGKGKKGVVTWDLESMGFYLEVEGLGSYDVPNEADEWYYKREVIGNIHEKQIT